MLNRQLSYEDISRSDIYKQFCCAVLYHHMSFLEGYTRFERNAISDLANTITFLESEFCLWLCEWCGIDYDSYMAKAQELFISEVDKRSRALSMALAKMWWNATEDASQSAPGHASPSP